MKLDPHTYSTLLAGLEAAEAMYEETNSPTMNLAARYTHFDQLIKNVRAAKRALYKHRPEEGKR